MQGMTKERPVPAAHLPTLPAGFEAQPAWGFRDPTGKVSYEFNRVYQQREASGARGPTSVIHEDLSFWGMTWAKPGRPGDDQVEGRWLTFSEARKLRGARMTFARFSSLLQMRDDLEGLMREGGAAASTHPSVGLHAAITGTE